jgi:hypothetical protein
MLVLNNELTIEFALQTLQIENRLERLFLEYFQQLLRKIFVCSHF